ncbi:RDD family protein [Lentibacillus sp. JNUCC-1]|uniref:RDD family protein n=1 Tax=Lentibacillus sp. JNUCC-1 TaxID=2654513 RepID=UPI0012E96592|nr:RDD family protein [Lentibacillus sp. JNUCC-1]
MCVNCHRELVSIKGTKYAGFWMRFAAYMIDGVILAIPMMIIGFIGFFIGAILIEMTNPYMTAYEYDSAMTGIVIIIYLIAGILGVLYFAGMHASKWQGTVGKKVVGIKVINEDGGRISFLKGVGRYFALFISGMIFYIGFIMAGFTSKKQALHDMMAKTLVVKS